MFVYAILVFSCMPLVYAEDENRIHTLQHDVDTLRAIVQVLTTENKLYKTEMELMTEKMRQLESKFDRELSGQKHEDKRLLITDQPTVSASHHVAFYTQLTKTLHLATQQMVVFDHIELNHGNGYSSLDGEFVCTLQGTYVLTWTITCSDNTAIETELVVNGIVKGRIFTDAGNHADYETNSGTAVLDLKVGDRVWIRVGHVYHGQIVGTGLGSSTFSGFLVNNQSL
uniref:Putative C1q domain containing protein MgC1q67 n=1 Tax=Mytilus galloprovincialis TaxID=29158 RepID=F0V4A4_MYTGA|nr:putative C1q domain containing protein MgC1q67 [Mytilus galloprovincialis]